jgi:hypothetical protein
MDGPMTAQTRLFPCLKDNYGVLVHEPATRATSAIDAPEAAPVEAALAAIRLPTPIKPTSGSGSVLFQADREIARRRCVGVRSLRMCRAVAQVVYGGSSRQDCGRNYAPERW